MQHIIDNLFHHAAMQARRAGGQHAMREDWASEMLHIVGNDIGAPMNGRVRLGRAIEGQCAAWTDA